MPAAKTFERRRPALWAALSFGTGVVLAHYATTPVLPLLVFSFLLALAGLALVLKGRPASALFVVLFLALGALRYATATGLLPENHIRRVGLFGQRGVVRGRVAGEPELRGEQTRFVLELEEVETDSMRYRVSGRVLVSARDIRVPAGHGDWISLRGRLQRPRPARNPGGFDYRGFLALQQLHGTLYLSRAEQIVQVEKRVARGLYGNVVLPVRGAVRQAIQRNLAGAPAGLLRGVLLGEKHCIPEEVRENFRRTGLAHALMLGTIGQYSVFFRDMLH